ncbi:F1F0 ATP synthase subunit delta KNAG_0K01440 [Huiozyma naganishii CBS 8797]|uniref:ATP synthase subunit delta, mitochondrial n=1 Tax=Huiozyma naganishii (strain ATCC MYA-139 / BCRC 22969 / CBS 8797 / KCTC 17520 / NBRC 10181 / NCYC 3082 / Yp74L-3) TaxID=1071383 RepID=J7SAW1_HUIN7|nr:hypothetical protein KNAG_0K01440 [Kazachstania naganishii CBS 8797]CCK72506.1 hypothetical protein KNAG_0K01440 [Kazachstania naganishii CBS 8797]
MLRTQAFLSLRRATRFYAAAATSAANELKLQFSLPHETLYDGSTVTQVNLPAQSGKIGVLANHIPTVEQLSPGIVEILEQGKSPNKYFISGGFATMQPDSTLCVTAVEAFPLESFSPDNVSSLLSKAKNELNSQDERVATEAKIQVHVLEELQASLK